jgi:FkbM family methyltransferase
VRIFNRQECAFRLRHFSILGSIDSVNWMVLHRKTDKSVFGARDLTPYTAELSPDSVARFVRIQLDGKDCLHFCECEVLGVEAEAARVNLLEANFTARLAEVEQNQRDRQQALRGGSQGQVTTIGNVCVFVDTDRYSPALIKSLTDGEYEGRERALVSELLRADDRVLEVGTAIGAVAMTAARIVGAKNVLTYEANPQIAEDARRNFTFNELIAIESRVGVLFNRLRFGSTSTEVEFLISRDFWASRLHAGANRQDIVETVRVPTACLEDQIAAHHATALISDIEGGEVDLFIGADLAGIRLIIMETHNWAAGSQSTDAMMRWLIVNGLNVDVQHSGKGIAVLRR